MRILVTGSKGQIAMCIAERARCEHELIFASRPQFDLTNEASIHRAVTAARPDVVISAAACTTVDAAEAQPDLAMLVNGRAPAVICKAAVEVGAFVIHLSTDYVFDGLLDRQAKEDDLVCPLNVYGTTKLAGEQAVATSGARFAIVRTSWVYSPYGTNFVRTMLRLARTRQEISVIDDQRGCPTSGFDIAEALLVIVRHWAYQPDHGVNAMYHFAGPEAMTWADFARAIFVESSRQGGPCAKIRAIPTSSYSATASRPPNSALDSALFRTTFDHTAPPWRRSLAEVVAQLLACPREEGAQ